MYQLTHRLILGSKSPRRQELLKGMGFDFELRTKETVEDYPSDLSCDEVADYLASIKADALLPTLTSNVFRTAMFAKITYYFILRYIR